MNTFYLRKAVNFLLLTLCLSILIQSHVAGQTTGSPGIAIGLVSDGNQLSAQDRTEVFEKVWKDIEEKYYDPAFNGINWQAVHDRYRPMLDTVKTDDEFYKLVKQMVRELHDAHTRFNTPQQRLARKKKQDLSTGLTIRAVEGQPVITSVAPDSDAAKAGVEPGMILLEVGGKPVDDLIAENRREIGASSSERASQLLVYSSLLSLEPEITFRLKLKRADGTSFEVPITRRRVSTASHVEDRILPSGEAYIKFDEFNSTTGKEFEAAVKRLKDAPGMIIDLRANGGGDVDAVEHTAGHFFDDKVLLCRIKTRSGKPVSFAGGLIKLKPEMYVGKPGGQIYRGPLVVLISGRSGSGAEMFAAGMQENGRATIIGTQSCGCVLGIEKAREVKGGGDLEISELSFVTSKGHRLEGEGVTPDKVVPVTIVNLQQKLDPALIEAEKVLKAANAKTP